MKSSAFATLLSDAFMSKPGDYPALKWETPTASVNFNITPANAQLTITKTGVDEGSAVYTGTGGTIALAAGRVQIHRKLRRIYFENRQGVSD